jgi:hypothetical protein
MQLIKNSSLREINQRHTHTHTRSELVDANESATGMPALVTQCVRERVERGFIHEPCKSNCRVCRRVKSSQEITSTCAGATKQGHEERLAVPSDMDTAAVGDAE